MEIGDRADTRSRGGVVVQGVCVQGQGERRPPLDRKVLGSIPAGESVNFRNRVIPVTSNLALKWLPW